MLEMKAIRTRRGISQERLSQLTGIHTGTLSRYERGHVSPSIGNARLVARALGVSLDALLGDVQHEESTTFDAPCVIGAQKISGPPTTSPTAVDKTADGPKS